MRIQTTASLMLLSAAIGAAAASAYWIHAYDMAPHEPFIAVTPRSAGDAKPAQPVIEDNRSDTGMLRSGAAPPFSRSSNRLVIPVAGVSAAALSDTYLDSRNDGERQHQGIDIAAPRGTAVLAAASGRIAKLFRSDQGGLTVYVRNRDKRNIYYYAHLAGYARGLAEGQNVETGDVIGYVGTTGNADPAAPHLHFEILETAPAMRWHEGQSINPYPILRGTRPAP